MKNKQGFTLIELIAIVGIIGLIVVIAYPIVGNYINNSKTQSEELTIRNIKSAALTYATEFTGTIKWVTKSIDENTESDTEVACIAIDDLIDSGMLKDNDIKTMNKIESMKNNNNRLIEVKRNNITKTDVKEAVMESSFCDTYDITPPTLSVNLYYENGSIYAGNISSPWTRDSIKQVINMHDANGIKKLRISKNGVWNTITTPDDNYEEIISEEYSGELKYEVTDYFNHITTATKYVNIDKYAPTCNITATGTLGNDNWYTSNVDLILSYSDSKSGVVGYGISNTQTPTYPSAITKITQTENTAGITYYGYVKDKVGLTNTCSITIKKDATAPTVLLNNIPSSFDKGSNYSIPSSKSFGISGGTVSCSPSTSTSDMLSGVQTISCTATTTAGLTTTISKNVTVIKPCVPKTSCNSCGGTERNGCGDRIPCHECYVPTTPTNPGGGGGSNDEEESCTMYEDQGCVRDCVVACTSVGNCVGTTIDGCEAKCTYCH